MVELYNMNEHSVSPVKNDFPITPPSSVEKTRQGEAIEVKDAALARKKLLLELKKAKPVVKRQRRLKFRPERNFVFDMEQYFSNSTGEEMAKAAEFVRYAFQYSKKIIVVTGAGISVAAGIPDFRSSEGLFSTLKGGNVSSGKQLFDYNHVYSSEDFSMEFNKMVVDMHKKSQDLEPTGFHRLLNQIAEEGRIKRIYTQNIDGLENKLSDISSTRTSPKTIPNTIQLHGSIHHMCCNKCHKVFDMNPDLFKCNEEDHRGSIIPSCPECEEFETVRQIAGKRLQGVGKLRPYIVLYNELHPMGEMIGDIVMKDLKAKCDCLLIVGTSLRIPGVKAMCKQFAQSVRSRKGIILWVNKELPSQRILDMFAGVDLVVLGDCQDLCKLVGV
ncbi:HEL160Cp [Eremothecium sinecaudum]|uniref:HEL160Cp n=1 Tax=Eremothecium sinecaudum TaxID=45286 RepID=A0A109UXC5_9SACH|nr:HEL160Cp [Eremothecium sinecaudum]AMD21121.1 HEL160Cp [Eremothecium sinecaudum]